MRQLYSYSIFQSPEEIPGQGPVSERLGSIGCDGFELFSLYDPIPDEYREFSPGVHLPYAIDWHRAWTGGVFRDDFDTEEEIKYVTYGLTREEMISNIRLAIDCAATIEPEYGVFHAGNTNLDNVQHHDFSEGDDVRVLTDFAEMMNTVVSTYPGGEPPFRLAFENLWWEGLKLRDPSEYRILSSKLEFDNWGFCLDTGHLMSTQPDSEDEESAIDAVLRVIDSYSCDMMDRIKNVHFHYSATAEYRRTFKEEDRRKGENISAQIKRLRDHVSSIDRHLPFSSVRCREIIDMLKPEYVVHEMMGAGTGDAFKDLQQQLKALGIPGRLRIL